MAAPPQPTAILRGHRVQVHAAAFVRVGAGGDGDGDSGSGAQDRLATGDADGFVVLWDLAIVRPRAVWRAHQNSILGLAGWSDGFGGGGDCQVATHGRDHRLVVWQLGAADEARLSTTLPLEDGSQQEQELEQQQQQQRPAPWMVHVLEVNTMNFCAFAWTPWAAAQTETETAGQRLVAVPNTLALEAVDIFQLPSQQRINTVKAGVKDGMLMALALFYHSSSSSSSTLVLIAAFENGATIVATLDDGAAGPATVRYRAQPHAQPILSLDVAPDHSYFLTSGADGIVAKHPIPVVSAVPAAAAAAVQKREPPPRAESEAARPVSLLSAALAEETATAATAARRPPPQLQAPCEPETQPLKMIDTKHAGQQGLRIRQDGRIFATAGWDGRARVYSAKTMKEVAVLKWHQTGCFVVAFAPVAFALVAGSNTDGSNTDETSVEKRTARGQGDGSREMSVKERRLRHAATAHWLAVGSKDGKVSLWDIF